MSWSGVRRGPLRPGEWVRLVDGKGRKHNICLEEGKTFHTNKGGLSHDDIIGREEGFTLTSTSGGQYLVFRPLLSEFVVSMPRGAAVVYPKDAAQIVAMADIFPGARVVEAGAGSGALTCSLLRAVGPEGRVSSFERREEFAEVARSGDLGYTWGSYSLAAAGTTPAERGYYARVWSRSADGTWKIALDVLQPGPQPQ